MQFATMELNKVYFYTTTILKWKKLLIDDEFKNIVIDSLRYLVKAKKIVVYGYVIMPNHLHLIWEMKEMNGKEMPHTSFAKFTGHAFLSKLKDANNPILEDYIVDSSTRMHHFWQRNSLPFELIKENTLLQKLNYIHKNPIQEHWKLVYKPEEYLYSSAKYYFEGKDDFGILTHWKDRE